MRKIVMSAVLAPAVLALAACGGKQPEADAPAEESIEEVAEVEVPEPPADVAFADLTGDAAAGETVFAQCRTCHLIDEGKNGVGPSLYGVIGRTAGTIEGFRYSDANANSGVTWTPEVMFEYLEAPREFMPGTRMAFPGLKNPQDRADVIAYLEASDD
ncbi:cytochrome c family protein [uncultured Erythrobacter sp.]|uniref:c-type cytochrome n=1 Tax=uncultured Erythrobacter sp. TaxID=263913 RepID=UPI002632B82B|nr:cytochrome c family protein [uncultured Erythrobacter sp.]